MLGDRNPAEYGCNYHPSRDTQANDPCSRAPAPGSRLILLLPKSSCDTSCLACRLIRRSAYLGIYALISITSDGMRHATCREVIVQACHLTDMRRLLRGRYA